MNPGSRVIGKGQAVYMSEERVTIGQVGKPHGIKGEVKIIPLTDDIRRFKRLRYVIINNQEYKVLFVKLQADRAILKLEGFDDPESLLVIKDKFVEIRGEDAVKKKQGEYYVGELRGLTVRDTDGVDLGVVFDVISTGSNDVYWIKSPKEILVPALKTIVTSIDLEGGTITIKPLKEWNYED